MTDFGPLLAQSLANGLGVGMVYILVALGLTLIFSIMRVINFAHGEFYMAGGFVAYYFFGRFHIHYVVTIVLGVLIVGALGVLAERLVFAPLRGRILNAFIASLGLSWVLQALAIQFFGVLDKDVPSPFPGVVHFAGVVISRERLVAIACSAALVILLYLFLQYSRHGLALRAVAQDVDTAALQGIDVPKVSALAFGIGAALAGVAGALLAPVFFVSPFVGTLPVVKAFIIIIIGGMGSLTGAILGGLILGIIEGIAPVFMAVSAVELLGFVLVILFLLFRLRGLLGHA